MALLNVVFRALNKVGTDFIEARREDGHGSSVNSPTFVLDQEKGIIPKHVSTSDAGDTIVVTPATGKKIRLWWYNISADPANSQHTTVALRFGANSAFYRTALSQYGAATAHSFKAGKSYYEGAENESLILSLNADQTIYCNIDYEEI